MSIFAPGRAKRAIYILLLGNPFYYPFYLLYTPTILSFYCLCSLFSFFYSSFYSIIENLLHLFSFQTSIFIIYNQFKETTIIIVMPETSEDAEKYISSSKVNIDNYIRKNDYRKAFCLFILFLERLDGQEKTQVIDYYSKNTRIWSFYTFSHLHP